MEVTKPSARIRDLLIVDDDPMQVFLFRHFLQELGHEHRCYHAANGKEALDFLLRNAPHANAPRPELIILDFNMPGMNGCEVLSAIKAEPSLRSIPVIMFSAGGNDDDIQQCYSERANAYVRKPADYDASLLAVKQIESFWLHTVRLPAH